MQPDMTAAPNPTPDMDPDPQACGDDLLKAESTVEGITLGVAQSFARFDGEVLTLTLGEHDDGNPVLMILTPQSTASILNVVGEGELTVTSGDEGDEGDLTARYGVDADSDDSLVGSADVFVHKGISGSVAFVRDGEQLSLDWQIDFGPNVSKFGDTSTGTVSGCLSGKISGDNVHQF